MIMKKKIFVFKDIFIQPMNELFICIGVQGWVTDGGTEGIIQSDWGVLLCQFSYWTGVYIHILKREREREICFAQREIGKKWCGLSFLIKNIRHPIETILNGIINDSQTINLIFYRLK